MGKDFKAKLDVLSNMPYLYLSIPADRSHHIFVSSRYSPERAQYNCCHDKENQVRDLGKNLRDHG